MTIPTITPLPQAPQVTDAPSVFSQRANTFVAALGQLVTETNATTAEINQALAGALVLFDAYEGDWEAGSYGAGDVVRKDDVFYISLVDSNQQEPPDTNWQELLTAAATTYDNTQSGLDATTVQAAIDEVAARSKLIGEVFYLWDHLDGVNSPDNSGNAKFIKLTANDAYNTGLLQNESVSGTEPLVEATAQISTGPLQGKTVHLINTEQAFLRSRESSGELQMDQMQRITGRLSEEGANRGFVRPGANNFMEGAFSEALEPRNVSFSTATANSRDVLFDSANSPNARTSETTSGETRSKNVSATAYMRIA